MLVTLRRVGLICLKFSTLVLLLYVTLFFGERLLLRDPARARLGPQVAEEQVQALRREMGLEGPIAIQFAVELRHLVRGNLGVSYFYRIPVLVLIQRFLPASLMCAYLALVIVGLGTLAVLIACPSRLREALIDLSRFIAAVPGYLLQLLLLAIVLRWKATAPTSEGLILVWGVGVGVPLAAWYLFQLAGQFRELEREPFVTRYTATGFRPSQIRLRLLKNITPVAVSLFINSFSYALLLTFFLEYLFDLQGFGIIYLKSVERNDIPVVTGGALTLAVMIMLNNLLGEVAIWWATRDQTE